MALNWRKRLDTILEKLRLKPLSLAEKCRIQFGAAVVFSLILALWVPYFWMGKLTEKSALDSGRAVAQTIFEQHFRLPAHGQDALPMIDETGKIRLPEDTVAQWFRIDQEQKIPIGLNPTLQKKLKLLQNDENVQDIGWKSTTNGMAKNMYLHLVRAGEQCLACHNPQGSASPYNKNQEIGVIWVQTSAQEFSKTQLLNRLWIIVAGLLAATGAMVAFYAITQRVILRPIRQLRALVNNIAEGNYDVRSAIKTGDEYERLSDAFNHMLDNLMESQAKLQKANQQLDAKIAQLSDKNIELFKANKLKSEFLANMSHEFRTPLNAILGFAELLREKPGADIEKSRRYAENIITSGRALLNMINDLLDLAKAEAGKLTLHIERTSIQQLCEGLSAFFLPLTEKKKLSLEIDVDPQIPLVMTDSGKMQQVLYNLLSNAIKFTAEGGRISVQATMPTDITVRIAVTDTGCGIPLEAQDQIFEKFRQLDGSITRLGEGTGLGLAICKQLTDLLAGTIGLKSEPGKGSTFWLEIPIHLQTPADEKNQ
ncbi:MAG: ATP-binding protein [Anaerohalosphaeraceae bacterium]